MPRAVMTWQQAERGDGDAWHNRWPGGTRMAMTTMTTGMKRLVDRRLPHVARAGRGALDAYRFRHARPEPSGLGFAMYRGSEFANRLVGAELPAFIAALGAAATFVDIGANVGFFTLLAARRGMPTLAVEPDPTNVQLLCRNIRLVADTAPVTVLPIAVSDRAGIVSLLGTGQRATLDRAWAGASGVTERLVPATTLDALLNGTDGPLLIKMDVEGHEATALRGATATLARQPAPTWLIEHGPEVTADYAEVFERFWSHGYAIDALPEAADAAPYRVTPADVAAWGARDRAPELMFRCTMPPA